MDQEPLPTTKSPTITFSTPQDVIDALPSLSEHHIQPLARYLNKSAKTGKDLVRLDPQWFVPLFSTAHGWRVICHLTSNDLIKTIFYKRQHVMLICLLIQKSFGSLKNVKLAAQVMNKLFCTGIITNDRYVTAILDYIHPDRVNEIDHLFTLLPKSTQTSTVPQPLHEQFTIPAECIPQLFPRFDQSQISQISPRYLWLLYLLSSVYSSISYDTFSTRSAGFIIKNIDSQTPGCFLPSFDLREDFIDINLFNSFDEYLAFKLPTLFADAARHPIPNTTFSYFTNQHPYRILSDLTPEEEKERGNVVTKIPLLLQSKADKLTFIVCFLLGTSLFSHYNPEFYAASTYDALISPFDALIPKISAISPALDYQIFGYKYRKHLLTADFSLLQDLTQPYKSTPTTFSRPYFPLTLSCLGLSWVHDLTVAQSTSRTAFQDANAVENLMKNCPLEFTFLRHLSKQFSPNIIDAGMVSKLHTFSVANMTNVGFWVNSQHTGSEVFELGINFIDRSWEFFQAGKDTLHQRLYLHMLLRSPILNNYENFHYLLFSPFLSFENLHPTIQKHIILCAHAGLLNPTTPTAFSESVFKTMSTSHMHEFPRHLEYSIPAVHRELTPFRAFVYAFLVRIAGYEVYFTTNCSKYDFLLEHVPAFSCYGPTPRVMKRPENVEVITSMTVKLIPDPLELPENNVKLAVADNDGKIVQLKFNDEGDNSNLSKDSDTIDGVFCFGDDSYCNISMFTNDGKSDPTFFDIDPYAIPKVNEKHTAELLALENQITLHSTRAVLLQNQYMKYFHTLSKLENDIIADVLDKVLFLSEASGLLSVQKDTSASPPSYPFPDLMIFHDLTLPASDEYPDDDKLDMEKKHQLSRWATEILVLSALNLQPYQPLKMDHAPGTVEFESSPSSPFPSQQSFNYVLDPKSKSERLIRLRDTVMNPSRLSLFDITILHPYYLSTPEQMQERSAHKGRPTKTGYLFDCCLDAIISPLISFYETLLHITPAE